MWLSKHQFPSVGRDKEGFLPNGGRDKFFMPYVGLLETRSSELPFEKLVETREGVRMKEKRLKQSSYIPSVP